jgi:hypothetical protein
MTIANYTEVVLKGWLCKYFAAIGLPMVADLTEAPVFARNPVVKLAITDNQGVVHFCRCNSPACC